MSAVPTLSDVAKRAGVSLATVDRVINKRPNVKPRTVERVRQAMADLNYRPDPLAAGLARRKRFRLLFLLPTGTNAFMIDLASQIEGMEAWLAASRIRPRQSRRPPWRSSTDSSSTNRTPPR